MFAQQTDPPSTRILGFAAFSVAVHVGIVAVMMLVVKPIVLEAEQPIEVVLNLVKAPPPPPPPPPPAPSRTTPRQVEKKPRTELRQPVEIKPVVEVEKPVEPEPEAPEPEAPPEEGGVEGGVAGGVAGGVVGG
ncbi:PaxA, partial [Myxococcus sp. AM011]|nr:PaxA [Myxococcus sp. AM011]